MSLNFAMAVVKESGAPGTNIDDVFFHSVGYRFISQTTEWIFFRRPIQNLLNEIEQCEF